MPATRNLLPFRTGLLPALLLGISPALIWGQANPNKHALREARRIVAAPTPDWEKLILVVQNVQDPEAYYYAGLAYFILQKWDSAALYLDKASRASALLGKRIPLEIWLLLGRAHVMQMNWNKARQAYLNYKRMLPVREYNGKLIPREMYIALFREAPPTPGATARLDQPRALVEKWLAELRTAQRLTAGTTSQQVKIFNVGKQVNTSYPEYGPVITADHKVLYFTGRRPDGINGPGILAEDGLPYEDIFYAEWNEQDSTWKKARPMPKPVNSRYHESILTISVDRRTMILYKDENQGDLYISYYRKGRWTEPQPLPEPVNSPYTEKSAAFSPDGKKLYFVSDRPGSIGGLDIWVTEMLGPNTWSEPRNLKEINTPYDEDGIFLHPDGKTLYFSSKGHNTMGGYDIFKSTLQEDGTWGPPENLGYPINSPGDDIYFVVSADGSRAYYSSSRTGTYGSMDIFTIVLTEKQKPKGHFILFRGVVVDADTRDFLEATVLIVNNQTGDTLLLTTTDPRTGEFVLSAPVGVNLGLYAEAPGYLFYSANYKMPDTLLFKEIFTVIELQRLKRGAAVALRNIFFEFASSDLLPESYPELDRVAQLLKRYPDIVVEIAGHTDSIGSDAYNQRLSEARARSVRQYLIKKGISPDRLVARGYGEKQPIADNSTEEGRALNRRVEIRILRMGSSQ